MRASVAQLSLFAVALLVGVLLVGQLRSQARPQELTSLSVQELSELIDTVSSRNRELRAALDGLREQAREYRLASVQGQGSVELTEESLYRFAAFGGLLPVEGQGIEMRIVGQFDPRALNDLIHELRNAGASAIAVDDVRITARSVAVLGPDAIEIDGIPIGPEFTVTAIGDPTGLFDTMTRPGGIKSQLELVVKASIGIRESRDLLLPATRLDLAPQVATPVE